MRLLKIILLGLMMAGVWQVAQAATATAASAEATAAVAEAHGTAAVHEGAAAEHHALPPKAVEIARIGPVVITNSMVITWGVTLGLIAFVQFATRKMQLVPTGAQNFLEALVEGLYGFLEGIIGPDLVKKTFWFFATIFIFILATNWVGLIPGVGTIGWGAQTDHGFRVAEPLLRGGNADLNMTLAMSMIFFVLWVYWALQANGPIGFLKHMFAPKGETAGFLKVMMVVVFLAVGVLEVISTLFRPISLSFRLFGNIFAGETMLETMITLVPAMSWVLPIPFYFMELLVGLVQALVFMLLTAVFTMLICQHDEESHGKAHH